MLSTEQIVTLLIQERDRLSRAIEALQGPVKRRGRPPKNESAAAIVPSAPAPEKKRKVRSAAQRKAHGERMKAYWAKRKQEEAKKNESL